MAMNSKLFRFVMGLKDDRQYGSGAVTPFGDDLRHAIDLAENSEYLAHRFQLSRLVPARVLTGSALPYLASNLFEVEMTSREIALSLAFGEAIATRSNASDLERPTL